VHQGVKNLISANLKNYPPLAKDPWVNALGKPFAANIRKNDPYIEQIEFEEFSKIDFGVSEFPYISIKIIKDIIGFDIQAQLLGTTRPEEELKEEVKHLEAELKDIRLDFMNQDHYRKLMRSFIALSENKNENVPSNGLYYITKRSWQEYF